MSVFAKMAKNPKLKRNLKTAVKGNPDNRYDGENAELQVVLIRCDMIESKGRPMAILEYRIMEGEHKGQKLTQFFVFADSQYSTAEENQAEFCRTLNLMGIETDGREDDPQAIDKDIISLIIRSTPILVRVSVTKSDGTRRDMPNITVLGLSDDSESPEDYSDDSTLAESEDASVEASDDDEEEVSLEDLKGAICRYKRKKYVINAASEDDGEVFLDLASAKDPDEVIHVDIPLEDVTVYLND